jgi:hypothetical protein
VTRPVRDVVTHPEYLDVSVPPGRAFTHHLPCGHTSASRKTFSYEAEGENYFDMERDRLIGDGHLALRRWRRRLGGRRDRLAALPAGLRPADR